MIKKRILFCIPIIIIFIFTLFFSSKYHSQIDVISSRIDSSNNAYWLDIDIIANQPYISDYEDFAYTVIQHCQKNDFHSVLFSYDINGYPTTLSGTVYLNKDAYFSAQPCFTFVYKSSNDLYTILDSCSNFKLTLKQFSSH